MKIAFIDRDGTLIHEPEDTKQVDTLDLLRMLPGVIEGLTALRDAGFTLVMVTNQDRLGTDAFPLARFRPPQEELLRLLDEQGIIFDAVFICPHAPDDGCVCRKPATGLVRGYIAERGMDASRSLMIGDRPTDEGFARNLGIRFVGMSTNGTFPSAASLTAR